MMTKEKFVHWSGFCWILAGLLVAISVVIHPMRETAQTILKEEGRLVTAHGLFTVYCVVFLLGLPGIYAPRSDRLGWLGFAGFLLLFTGTLLFAVSGDYGFNAPVLARMAPQTLDAINAYPPVAIVDGLFVVCLLAGFLLFGLALRRSRDLPHWAGLLAAAGWLLFMTGGALSLTIAPALWAVELLGAVLMGLGISWIGWTVWKEEMPEMAAVASKNPASYDEKRGGRVG